MNESLDITHEYSAAPRQVWEALTNESALGEWLMRGKFIAEEGFEYSFSEPGLSVRGVVLKVDPGRQLRYLWVTDRESEDGGAGSASIVTWTLSPTKTGGTSLRLKHEFISPTAPIVSIEASINWSFAMHSSIAGYLGRKYAQPIPIVYVVEKIEPEPEMLKRAGFRQPEEVAP
jgi:uncharacterized protein YndB with AHSA1/START domain